MTACSHCGTMYAAGSALCPKCGLFTAVAATNPVAATVRWTGKPLGLKTELRRVTPLDQLFAKQNPVVIGRAPECAVCLSHPMVSRRHALLERCAEGLRLSDLGSVNGVTVGAHRIGEPVLVRELVGIGPFLFAIIGGFIHTIDSSRSLRLEARELAKQIRLPDGKPRTLLDNINLAVEPGEFVSLLGPSGSGKSTLMDCLNGRRRASSGQVLANGEDFYRHFDSFRQSLGYVPQRDIVHTQLSVYRALYYTARLRLPTDTTAAELMTRIETVIGEMELGPHRDTLVANLSGGQIKRVSLGAELLARPCLLYIDEATSGLDAGTEARMMRLFRQLADEGKSIVCITHNVDNVDRCHLIIVLARGRLIYYGPPHEATSYFNVQRISDIYDRLAAKDLLEWEKQFTSCCLYQEFVLKRLANGSSGPAAGPVAAVVGRQSPQSSNQVSLEAASVPRPVRPPLWHQFRVLTARYAETTWGDKRSLKLLLLQAPLVALFVLAGFVGKPYEQTMPVLRHLEKNEDEMLQVVTSIDKVLGEEEGQLSRADQERLSRLILHVKKPGGDEEPLEIDGSKLVRRLHDLYVSQQQHPNRILDDVEVTLKAAEDKDVPGRTVTFSQLLGLQKTLHDSGMSNKLLEANRRIPIVPTEEMIDPRYTYMLLFMLVIVVLWFGCNNAAKEIVKEDAIYGRERAVNLGILPYLASKFLVLSLVTALQAAMLLVLIYGTMELLHLLPLEVPAAVYQLNYLAQFGVLTILAMTGVALGLLLSACVASPDRANALLPYVLIPQIILGGGIMPVKDGPLYFLAMALSPVYWAFRVIHVNAHTLPDYVPYHLDGPDKPWLGCGILMLEMAGLLLLTAWFLRQKDAIKNV